MKKYKKVDSLMRKFVEDSNGDVNKDLAKLEINVNSVKECKRKNSVLKWASVAVTCFIVVVLSITLPLTLINPDTGDNGNITYCNNEDIIREPITSQQELYDVFLEDLVVPAIKYSNVICEKLIYESKTIGIELLCSIYDDKFDTVSCYVLYEKYEIPYVTIKFDTNKTVQWRNLILNYKANKLSSDLNEWRIKFKKNSKDYYYKIVAFENISFENVLELVF